MGSGYFQGVSASKKVRSFQEIRDEGVVFQQLDYSCGSAALATLLRNQARLEVDETEIIEFILKTGDLKKIVGRQGFSLLDMKRFVEDRGYRAAGYRLDRESLVKMGSPFIVPILVNGYRHFVVIRAIRKGRVFLSDPARGKLTLPFDQFERFWYAAGDARTRTGIAFAIFRDSLVPREDEESLLRESDHQYVDSQEIRFLTRHRIFSVPPVPGEF